MSPARSTSASSGGGTGAGRGAITALIVVGVAIGLLLLIRSRPGVESYDPRSGASNGANGAVLLLQQYGAQVSITATPPAPDADERVFVIADRLDADQRVALLDFVDAGGVAVVADPASTLHGGPGLDGGAIEVPPVGDLGVFTGSPQDASEESNIVSGDCTIAALHDLRGVRAPHGILFPTSGDEQHCFGDARHSFVVVRHYGAGVIVGFGNNDIVTNGYLRYGDNAGLVTALLAPADGAHVRIMLGSAGKPSASDVGRGDEKLADLVRPGIWMALTQLAIAFVVFCVARGIRPGRAVREPVPTPIAGNELMLATGNMMQRAHHFERAGWLIRGEFYRELCAHHRAPPGISIHDLCVLVGNRTGVPVAELESVVRFETTSAQALMDNSAHIDRLRAVAIAPHESVHDPRRLTENA